MSDRIQIHIDGGAFIPWAMKSIIAQATSQLTQYIKTGPPSSSYRDAVTFYRRDSGGIWVPVQWISQNEQWMLNVDDMRQTPAPFEYHLTSDLRKTQADVCGRAEKMIRACGGTTLVLPTGSGKTVCALHLISRLKVKPIIFVHKSFLMEQWKQRIAQFFGSSVRVTTIQGAEYDDSGDIVIAMMQTFYSRNYTAPESCGLLIVDECHHIPAKTFRHVISKSNLKYRLGLSATPERQDGLDPLILMGPMSGLHESVTSSSPGFLNGMDFDGGRIHIQLMEYTSPEYIQPPPTTFSDTINHAAMLNTVAADTARTRLICNTIKSLDQSRHVLCLVHRKQHAQDMMDILNEMGLQASIFSPKSGGVCPDTRIVISTFIFASEGFDEQRFDTLVLCSPTTDVRQSIGRILRRMHDQDHFPFVIDIVDQWSIFKKQAFKRRNLYRSMGCTIKTKQVLRSYNADGFMFRQESSR